MNFFKFHLPFLAASSFVQAAPVLTDYDRGQVVQALLAADPKPVEMEFLSEAGGFAELRSALDPLGARIRYADARVGYIYALMPRDKVLAALAVARLESAAIPKSYPPDDLIPQDGRRPAPVPAIRLPIPTVAKDPLPPGGIYSPFGEAGLTGLWRDHPEADGRGARIGFADYGFDLLHPAIRSVSGPDGGLLPKVADLNPMSTPDTDNGWVVFGPPTTAVNHRVTACGRDWIVPANETYRVGIYAQKQPLASFANPDKRTVTIQVGVLWDTARDLVRVDTDGDGDFTNNRPLHDYALNREIDWFGKAENGEDNRIPFGIKIDRTQDAVWLSAGSREHGTWIGGAAGANLLTGGLFVGAAPQAELVDVRTGWTILPAMIRAAAQGGVDVVNLSGGVARPGGQEDFQRLVLARMVDAYDKPVMLFGSAPGTVSVNDYASPDMQRRNRQLPPPYVEAVTAGVVFCKDGLVNLLMAPSALVLAQSRYLPTTYLGSDGRRYVSPNLPQPPAPEGYAIGSNPSCTIGFASGVVADLISLAKRQGMRYNGQRITEALFLSARPLAGIEAANQGHGEIDADAAWKQLVAMADTDDPANPALTSFVVERACEGGRQVVQGYAEDFPSAGGPQQRSVWVTRRGGRAGARPYALALRMNDGAFEFAQTGTTLPRDKAVRIDFTVHSGADEHVAFLDLIDATTGTAMHEIPLTSRAPEAMETVGAGVARLRSRIAPRRGEHRWFTLEEGPQAVSVSVEMPYIGYGLYQGYNVTGPGFDWGYYHQPADLKPEGAPIDAAHHVGALVRGEATRLAVPGLMAVYWENRARPEYETPYDPPAPDVPVDATLTLKKFAVTVEKTSANEIAVHNRMAGIDGRVEWLSGTPESRALTPDDRGFGAVQITVPEGAALLRVAFSGRQLPGGAAGVYALNCSGKTPDAAEHASMSGGRATLLVRSPKAGVWKLAVLCHEPGGVGGIDLKIVALAATPANAEFASLAHDAAWNVSVPAGKTGEATYAAVRLRPALGEKEGLLIGLTPISADKPGDSQ